MLDKIIQSEPFADLLESGFKVRPATLDDLPSAVHMFNAAERELVDADIFTLERYEQEWQVPGLNLETDTRVVFTPKGELAGLIEVWAINDPPVHPSLWARVDPKFQRLGIGSAMMTWGFSRAAEVLDRLEADVRLAPRASTIRNHKPSTALFEGLGMTPIRYAWTMVIELDSPPTSANWPDAIELSAFVKDRDAAAVYRAQVEIFRDHWGFVEQDFDVGFKQWKHLNYKIRDFDPELWFIAKEGDEIAGLALCLPHADQDHEMGWVEVLGVRRPWRQQGLGLALLQHAFQVYFERGLARVGLGVDSDNLTGATRLYKKAGMQAQREHVVYEIELRPGRELERID